MSSCNTSAWLVAQAKHSSRVLIAVLLLTEALVIGCKSVSNEPDQPEPTPTVAPAMTPKPSDTSHPPPTANMQGTSSSPMASDASHTPGDVKNPAEDDDASVPDPMDAGTWVPPDPTCTDGDWRVAPGLLPAMRVDYIADRDMRFPAVDAGEPTPTQPEIVVLSSAGKPCANARDRAACEKALALRPTFGRHLVTTSGDSVHLWLAPALPLLGQIDTPSEAIWVMQNLHGNLTCNAAVSRDGDDFIVSGLPNWSCMQLPDGGQFLTASARVTASGALSDLYNDAGMLLGACE